MLLIKAYRDFIGNGSVEYDSPGVISAKESWIRHAAEIHIVSLFLKDFEFTNSMDDFIKSSDINDKR